tara:strand:- start:204 stop:1250 length:1047 start_codon:yes stop_codon:yes gene_type:complete
MKKGIFFIPVYKESKPYNEILDEVISSTVSAEKMGLSEAYYGEHITDRFEKIASSLMMIASVSHLTNKIKLGSLTTNLNFYKPAALAAWISTVDNMTKGRFIMGIGAGANQTDLESLDLLEQKNYELMLELESLVRKLLNSKDLVNLKTDNYKVSTLKTGNPELGLGYFNGLYKQRDNLDIIMPALGKGSYNVKMCAKNKWSIAISNFCSDEIVKDHIENYLNNSPLEKKDALKKIRLTKLLFLNESQKDAEKYAFDENSPYMEVIDTIFTKLKTFKRHNCFGENVNCTLDAAKKVLFHGTPEKAKDYISSINNQFGELGSVVFVSVPKTNNRIFDESLKLFSKELNV